MSAHRTLSMAKGAHVISLALIFRLWLLFSVTTSENCPVNPDCSCPGSYVYCVPKCGPSVPKFVASSKQFSEVVIDGSADINQILPGTFQGISTRRIYIQNTGITNVDCDAFKGIKSGLETLSLTPNYLESVPSCSLQYVNGITYLLLTGNRISNLTRNAFSNAPDLRTLHVNRNQIETVERGSFITLNKLTSLNLDRNKISYLGESVFEGMSSLKTLLISRSKIKSVHPKSFAGLDSLTYLELNENEIGALDGTTFGHLIHLTGLNLGINLISFLPEKIFATLKKLNIMFLRDNQLVSLPDNIFQKTTLLRTLYIQRNNLSGISPRLFRSTPNLSTLDISENRIENLEQDIFTGLGLRDVNIYNNHLTTVKPDVFKDCNNLWKVSMKKNRIRDLQPGSFRNLPSLSTLDLSENYLSEIHVGVFKNSTHINTLHLADNEISVIENGAFESQQDSLRTLNFRSNKLSHNAWAILTPTLTKLERLRYLDLSHNPIGDLPKSAIDSFKHIDVRLRNCNLTNLPFNNTGYHELDLSANNLKNLDVTLTSHYYSLNVSANKLQSVSLRIFASYNSISLIDAQQNEIQDIAIISMTSDSVVKIYTFLLSNNSISTSIGLKTNEFGFNDVTIYSLDLSCNKFNSITNYPIRLNSSVPIDSDLYRYIMIHQLDLSRNNISFVSPEAFLGRIGDLDLSHNRIQVLGGLVPANTSRSDFNTKHLDLSGNFIHQISAGVFSGFENIIVNINLAQNALTEVQSLRNVLEEESFERLYLSDNPLNCDCESFWLRQESVSSKLDSVRCDTPDNAKGYMSFCYPLENCSLNQTLNFTDSVPNSCQADTMMSISNLQLTTLERIGKILNVKVTWARHGPGHITYYKLDVTPVENSENLKTSLVHPAAVSHIMYGLELEKTYNACISAQREQVTVSEVVCKSLQVEDTEDNIVISRSVLVAISSALALCVLCIVVMVLCYFIRLQKVRFCHQKDTTTEISFSRNQTQDYQGDNNANLTGITQNTGSNATAQTSDSNPSQTYEHPSYLNDDVTNTYEMIHNAAYENYTNPTEDSEGK